MKKKIAHRWGVYYLSAPISSLISSQADMNYNTGNNSVVVQRLTNRGQKQSTAMLSHGRQPVSGFSSGGAAQT